MVLSLFIISNINYEHYFIIILNFLHILNSYSSPRILGTSDLLLPSIYALSLYHLYIKQIILLNINLLNMHIKYPTLLLIKMLP